MAVYVPKVDAGPVDDLIEQLAAEVAARYAAAEERMIRKVAELTAKFADAEVIDRAAARAKALGELRREAQVIVGDIRGSELAAQVMHIAATEGSAAAVERLGLVGQVAGGTGLSSNSASALAQMTLDLSSRLDRMEERMTRWMPDIYQRTTAIVVSDVLLGTDTARRAQKRAVEMLLAKGVDGFADNSGRKWKPGSYAEMATRTSVNRAWMESNMGRLQEDGVELVSIVGGADLCKKCAAWVGKILSADGSIPAGVHLMRAAIGEGMVAVTVHGSVAQARLAGWNHPNCRCVPVGAFPGLTIPGGSTYDPQAEADRERMREIERNIRKWKRREAASLDDAGKFQAKRKVKEWQGKARRHVDATGVGRKNYREQLHFSDGMPRPRRAPSPTPVLPPNPTIPRAVPAPAPKLPPTPPKAIAPAPLAKRSTVDITADVAAAKTAKDVGAAFARKYPDVETSGWGGRNLDIDRVRQAVITIDRLMDKYPGSRLSSFALKPIKSRGTIAQARARVRRGPPKEYFELGIEVNADDLRVGANLQASFETHQASGHFHATPGGGDAVDYAVTHEFGHIMDFATSEQLNVRAIQIDELRRIGVDVDTVAARDWMDKQTSGYGRWDRSEQIAEAFADVEVNGANAKPFSQAIHDRLVEMYRGTRS